MDEGEYIERLNKKLKKEPTDLVEVVFAIVEHKGVSIDEFEEKRLKKREKREGFEKKLFLLNVLEI